MIYLWMLERQGRTGERGREWKRERRWRHVKVVISGKREVYKSWNTKINGFKIVWGKWQDGTETISSLKLWILVSRRVMNFNSNNYFDKDFWFLWEIRTERWKINNCLLRNIALWKFSGFYSLLIVCQHLFRLIAIA